MGKVQSDIKKKSLIFRSGRKPVSGTLDFMNILKTKI